MVKHGRINGHAHQGGPDGAGRAKPAARRPLNTVDGVQVGCFPDLYAAPAGNPPDQVITL